MNRNDACDLFFKEKNILIDRGNFNYAHKNKNNIFWANPFKSSLERDWWIILDDEGKKKLFLLFVPAKSLTENQFYIRQDEKHAGQIQLQFKYEKDRIVDTTSKLDFTCWLYATLDYTPMGIQPIISKVFQQIFFGAPGTGKSHKVNELVGEHESFLAANDREARFSQFSQCGCAKANHYADVLSKQETFNQDVFAINNLEELKSLLESCDGDDKVKNPRHSALRAYIDFVSQPTVFRTTFHPDYDYAQFVGSYKPKKENGTITYSFVPQVFAKAYKRAKETGEPVYLVIEEINRGNCAQIFGDIFQLLDRNESGESQYEIDVDSDFAEWLGESKIKLPANFNILATMNTSDQSLFPMDSAFKRRFDWEYVPIKYFKDSKCGESWNADKFEIKLDDNTSFSWLHFLKKVNADIYKVTESEDKQMGEFFVKPKDGVIGLDMFRSKILFYLWDSVYKDEPDKKNVFHFDYPDKSGSKVTFQSLFSDDAKAIEIINQMMKNLDEAYESKDDSEFKDFKILK